MRYTNESAFIQPDAPTPDDDARLEAYAAAMAGTPDGDILDAEYNAHEDAMSETPPCPLPTPDGIVSP